MLELVKYAVEIDIDYPAFHPVAPVPGSYLYQEAQRDNSIAEQDFKKFDWSTPVMRSSTGLSRADLAELNMELNKRYVLYRPHWLVRGLFSRYKHKRGLYWWFFTNTLRMILLEMRDLALGRKKKEGVTGFMRLRRPRWYDS
jgi:hypothetical protein